MLDQIIATHYVAYIMGFEKKNLTLQTSTVLNRNLVQKFPVTLALLTNLLHIAECYGFPNLCRSLKSM